MRSSCRRCTLSRHPARATCEPAATDECPVQASAQGKLAFGTQFHAENCDDAHPDGRTIIRNFFGIAGLLAPGE